MAVPPPLVSGCSVVVPVYNGAGTVEELADRLDAALARAAGEWEILFVNDGSRDASWDVIRQMAQDRPRVRGIDLDANRGQPAALLVGISEARYDVVVTLDDDLQHDPADAPRLLAAVAAGHDLVYGVPRRSRHPWWKRVAGLIGRRLLELATGAPMFRHVQSYRAFRRPATPPGTGSADPAPFLDGLLWDASPRVASVPVAHREGRRNASSYSVLDLVAIALPALVARGRWWRIGLLATAGAAVVAGAAVAAVGGVLAGLGRAPAEASFPAILVAVVLLAAGGLGVAVRRRRQPAPGAGARPAIRARAGRWPTRSRRGGGPGTIPR